jgi:hypothetical protein
MTPTLDQSPEGTGIICACPRSQQELRCREQIAHGRVRTTYQYQCTRCGRGHGIWARAPLSRDIPTLGAHEDRARHGARLGVKHGDGVTRRVGHEGPASKARECAAPGIIGPSDQPSTFYRITRPGPLITVLRTTIAIADHYRDRRTKYALDCAPASPCATSGPPGTCRPGRCPWRISSGAAAGRRPWAPAGPPRWGRAARATAGGNDGRAASLQHGSTATPRSVARRPGAPTGAPRPGCSNAWRPQAFGPPRLRVQLEASPSPAQLVALSDEELEALMSRPRRRLSAGTGARALSTSCVWRA